MVGTEAQWAQNNKFVESGWKSWVLSEWDNG